MIGNRRLRPIGLSLPFLWLILPLLLLGGCAGAPVRPQPPLPPPVQLPLPSPPQVQIPPPPQTYAKLFPEFVAVIAQPGDTFSSLAGKYLNEPSLDWLISEFNDSESLSPGQELIIPLKLPEKGGLTFQGYQMIPVLTYHKFSKNKSDNMTVTEKAFEEQMRFLKQQGYRVISMNEFFNFLELKSPIPKKSVVITIDDGWRSTYEIAFPILKKYGYPATLFVYTDLISPNDETLGWDLIRKMAQGGIDVQGHTKTHRKLERSGQESLREFFEAVKRELTESAKIIKRHLNKDVQYLAYPYGDTNTLVIALLMRLGYRGAFTVERGSNPFFTHPHRLKRSMIYGHFDLQDFEKNLTYFSDEALR